MAASTAALHPLPNDFLSAVPPPSLAGSTPVFSHTTLRVANVEASKKFYGELLGMKLLRTVDYNGEAGKNVGYLYGWGTVEEGGLVELRWEGGLPEGQSYCNGNVEPGRGFGHVGILVLDLFEVLRRLEAEGVKVIRKPGPFEDVGSIAFVADPDGYWVEVIQAVGLKGGPERGIVGQAPIFAQTMLRIKDPRESIRFFQKLGMTFLTRLDFPRLTFSLFFMAYVEEGEHLLNERPGLDAEQSKRAEWLWSFPRVTVELTHNWGTESEEGPVYHHGNSEPLGFGHLGIKVGDASGACEKMQQAGYQVVKKPALSSVNSQTTAVIQEPTGYWIKLIEK